MNVCLHVILCATAVALPTWSDAPRERTSQDPPPDARSIGEMYGIAQPWPTVTLSAPINGVLHELLVREGQRVEQGQLLAVIDNRVTAADVAVAEISAASDAEVLHAEQELALAESLLKRRVDAGAGAAAFEVEEARVRRSQAESRLIAARQEREAAKRRLQRELARLEQHNIRATFAGTILKIDTEKGATVTDRDKLFVLANLKKLRVEIHLPLRLYGTLQEGRSYRLDAGIPINKPVTGRLEFASPQIDAAMKTFRCTFAIDNRNLALPAGLPIRFASQTGE